MKSITYGVIEELYALDGQKRISYGIAAYADAACDKTATVVAAVRDVSTDQQRLQGLAAACNRLQLSPVHLPDVVSDLLAASTESCKGPR